MQRDPAPELDSDRKTVAVDRPEATGDPVSRLLDEPPTLGRRLQLRHWIGVLGLVAAVGVTAFVIPPMLAAEAPVAQSAEHSAPPSLTSSEAVAAPPAGTTSLAATSAATTAPPASVAAGPAATQGTAAAQPPTGKPTATATTKRTTAGQAAFTPIGVQAEASGNTLSDGAGVVDCATCDGGARVRWIGRLDVHLTVPVSGTRKITFLYETDGDRSFDVSINGDPPVAVVKVTGSDWVTPRSVSITASVPSGSVDIGLYGYAGNAPDFDKITIS